MVGVHRVNDALPVYLPIASHSTRKQRVLGLSDEGRTVVDSVVSDTTNPR